METKNFLNYLQKKFPCADLEVVLPTVVTGDFVATPEFWQGVDNALRPYSQDEALRCVDIIDRIGRYVNCRSNEVTLSHCKNLDFAKLMLEYIRLALFWREDITCLHVLTFLDIEFELENGTDIHATERCDLLRKCEVLHHLLRGYTKYFLGRIYVHDTKLEREYVQAYDYVYKNAPQDKNYTDFFKAKGLID